MKIQFGAILKDRRGKDMAELDATQQPPAVTKITLAAISFAALDLADPNEGLGPKLRRAEIMSKIAAAESSLEPLELLDADVALIKDRIGKCNFTTSLTAAAIDALVPVPEKAADAPAASAA